MAWAWLGAVSGVCSALARQVTGARLRVRADSPGRSGSCRELPSGGVNRIRAPFSVSVAHPCSCTYLRDGWKTQSSQHC